MGGNDTIYFHTFFGVSKKFYKTFLTHHKEIGKIKKNIFYLNYYRMLVTWRVSVNKVFSSGIFISKKMVPNMKHALTMCLFDIVQLVLIQGSRVQNHWVAPRSTQPFILPRSTKWVPGISGNLVIKSKLPPLSDSSFETVEPHP